MHYILLRNDISYNKPQISNVEYNTTSCFPMQQNTIFKMKFGTKPRFSGIPS